MRVPSFSIEATFSILIRFPTMETPVEPSAEYSHTKNGSVSWWLWFILAAGAGFIAVSVAAVLNRRQAPFLTSERTKADHGTSPSDGEDVELTDVLDDRVWAPKGDYAGLSGVGGRANATLI